MSQGYEHQDAFLFALEYGADMVKVDACAATLPAEELMTRWKTQLNATGRPVLFSNCHNGCETDHDRGEPPPPCRSARAELLADSVTLQGPISPRLGAGCHGAQSSLICGAAQQTSAHTGPASCTISTRLKAAARCVAPPRLARL